MFLMYAYNFNILFSSLYTDLLSNTEIQAIFQTFLLLIVAYASHRMYAGLGSLTWTRVKPTLKHLLSSERGQRIKIIYM